MWMEMGLNFKVGEDAQYQQLTNLSEHVGQSVTANEQERESESVTAKEEESSQPVTAKVKDNSQSVKGRRE